MKKTFLVSLLIVVLLFVGCSSNGDKTEMKKLVESEWTEWGSFNMEGRNFTPPRLVDTDQYQYLELKAEYSTDKSVLFTLGAYSMEHDTIGQYQTLPPSDKGVATVKLPIKKDQEIQVFAQIWDEKGNYDDNYPVDIILTYRLVN